MIIRAIGTAAVVALACTRFAYSAQSDENIASWTYRTIEDKMNDKTRHIVFAGLPGQGSIVFKCDETGANSVYASFVSGKYLGASDSKRDFKFRIDKNKPVTQQWSYDKQAAYNLDHKAVLDMAKHLKGAHTLLVNAITYEYETVESEIDITGADQALDRLYTDCADGTKP